VLGFGQGSFDRAGHVQLLVTPLERRQRLRDESTGYQNVVHS